MWKFHNLLFTRLEQVFQFFLFFLFHFHNYRGLNGFVNSFSQFTIAPLNNLILGCKPVWSAKMKKKKTSCEKWLFIDVLQISFFFSISQISQESTCVGVFFNKVAGPQNCNFIKETPVKFAKFLGTPYFTEHLQWLLLTVSGF